MWQAICERLSFALFSLSTSFPVHKMESVMPHLLISQGTFFILKELCKPEGKNICVVFVGCVSGLTMKAEVSS